MVKRILWLVALGAAVYIGWSYGRPYFRAWRFRDAMSQQARLSAVSGREEAERSLLETARDLGIPLESRDLTVRKSPRGPMSISASWREIVTIRGGPLGTWVDTLRFDYEATPRRGDDR